VSTPRKTLFVFHKGLTEPIPRLHGLAQVRALAGARRFAVISFEPRWRRRTRDDRELYLATRAWLREAGVEHVALPLLGSNWLDIPLGAIAILVLALFRGVRIVHTRSYVPGLMALLVRPLAPVRFLFDPRGLFVDEYIYAGALREGRGRLKFARWLERRLYAAADATVVLSGPFRDHLLSRGDLACLLDPASVSLIPDRVDFARFRDAGRDRAAGRADRGWDGAVVGAYVASSAPWHRLDESLRVMRGVMAARPDVRFVVATYPSTARARALAEEAGVPVDRVDFVTAPVADVPGILTSADFAIMFEARHLIREVCAPVKFSEYVAAGLPVVANDGIGDVSGWIRERRLGLLVDPDDADEAAARVVEYLASDDFREGEARRRCLRFGENEMDMRRTLEEYEAVYRSLDCT